MTMTTVPDSPFQPANRNFLKSNRSTFVLSRTPHITYFCQDVALPSVELGSVGQENPFIRIAIPGDRLTFGDLTVEFLVEEDMTNYMEIYDWMIAIGYPDDYGQYKNAITKNQATGSNLIAPNPYSDGTLLVNSSSNNLSHSFQFLDMFPISLGNINFSTKNSEELTCQAVFKYRKFARKTT